MLNKESHNKERLLLNEALHKRYNFLYTIIQTVIAAIVKGRINLQKQFPGPPHIFLQFVFSIYVHESGRAVKKRQSLGLFIM